MDGTPTLQQLRNNSYYLVIRSSLLVIQSILSLQQTILQSDHGTFTDIKSTIASQNTALQNSTKTLVEYFFKISSYQPTLAPPSISAVAAPTSTTTTPSITSPRPAPLLTPSCCLASPTLSHVTTTRSTPLSSTSVHTRTDAAPPAISVAADFMTQTPPSPMSHSPPTPLIQSNSPASQPRPMVPPSMSMPPLPRDLVLMPTQPTVLPYNRPPSSFHSSPHPPATSTAVVFAMMSNQQDYTESSRSNSNLTYSYKILIFDSQTHDIVSPLIHVKDHHNHDPTLDFLVNNPHFLFVKLQSNPNTIITYSGNLGDNRRLIFDPGGKIEFDSLFAARFIYGDVQLNHNPSSTTSTSLPSTYDLEDKVDFEGAVMIRINLNK